MEKKNCRICEEELNLNCFRSNREECKWCEFEDPSFRASCRFNDKRKQKKWEIESKEDFVNWYKSQEDRCHYCGVTYNELRKLKIKKLRGFAVSWDIDRKDNDKPYTLKNIVLSCSLCNMAKGAFFRYEEFLEIAPSIRSVIRDRLK